MAGPSWYVPRHRFALWIGVVAVALPVSVAAIVTGCQQVPVTQRSRVMLTTSESQENELGLTAYQEVLKEEPLTKTESYVELVRRVGKRISAVADRPDFQWEFNVIESEQQNAFCLPGGKVAVYTGILPVCETEAGLAVVMSHEVAHALARHGGERMQHQTVQNLGRKAATYFAKDQEETHQKFILAAYGVGSQYGMVLPYSRTHEMEADHIGLMLMAEAGYDPSEAPEFWERFGGQKKDSAPMEFLSTHPSDERRSLALRELLPEAQRIYDKSAEKYGSGEQIR